MSIIAMAASMFTATFLAGSIPRKFEARAVTLLGAGLLVGAALIVIVPEGMEVLEGEGASRYAGPALAAGFVVMLVMDLAFKNEGHHEGPLMVEKGKSYGTLEDIDSHGPSLHQNTR